MTILVLKLSPLKGVTSSMMRAIGLVNGLVELGHQIDFLTTPASHHQIAYRLGITEFGPNVRLLETNPNTLYTSIVSGKQSGVRRHIIALLRKLYKLIMIYDHTLHISKSINPNILESSYDLVISISDPKTSHLSVINLRKKGVCFDRWISYWGDPMALDITNKSIIPKFIYRHEESRMLSSCDKIVYTNPLTADMQKRLFPKFSKRITYSPTAISQNLECTKEEGAPFRVSYIGAYHSRIRNILPFYHAAIDLQDKVETFIIGDSDLTLDESENVHVFSRREAIEVELSTDLFICVLNKTGTQIPGKIYHYAASNRRILVILDGEEKHRIQNYLEGFDRYDFCENNQEDIAAAIMMLKESDSKAIDTEIFSPVRIAKRLIS